MQVKIYGKSMSEFELVKVTEVVDIDFDDRRIYVKTWEGSEVWPIRFEDAFVFDEILPDPRLSRRAMILATFRDEALNKAEADALYQELVELDQSLNFHPSDTCQAHILATWGRDEIAF